jgi:hypothetical protein
MPKREVGDILVSVGALADGEISSLTLIALTADDGERNDHAVAYLELLVGLSNLDDLAHKLVAHDVAGAHPWHVAVIEMEIRATDRAACDFNDRISRIFDHGIRNCIATDVVCSVIAKRFHEEWPFDCI